MFREEQYIDSTLIDSERTPEETVLEYINVFSRWSKDCHSVIKYSKKGLTELNRQGAYLILGVIRRKYCVPRNRQYERRTGHYYVGGASLVNPQILSCEKMDSGMVAVFTKPDKEKQLKSHRFILKKAGKVWKIASLASNSGINRWRDETI